MSLAPMTLAPMTLAPGKTDVKVQLRLDNLDDNLDDNLGDNPDNEDDAWFTVCDLKALIPGRGAAALLPDGRQAALFMDRAGKVYALDNRDPFTGAAVLSRGLTGTHQGRPYVASPLLKQRFELESGQCLDDETVRVATYEVRTS